MYDLKGKGRLVVFLIIVVCLTLVLLGRYVYLMLFLPGQESEEALEPPTVERGPILDRHGKILAITTTLDSVSAWIPALENLEQTVEILEEVLDIDREAVLKTLTTKDGFAFIKRKITPTESSRISTLMADGKLPGIKLEPEYGRNYPLRNSAAHLVGYVSLDNNGLDGIEWSYQSQLSPASLGRDIDYIYGNQVFLTIDANVQHFMEKIGVEAMIETQADSIMLLVMNAQTGEVLAYVSLPDFDPNIYPGTFTEYDPSALLNRPARMGYEPGSVFKIFTLASFLQLGGLSFSDQFTCTGIYDRVDPPIRDLRDHGVVDVEKILQYSCNVGAALASETVDREGFFTMLQRFGFGERTGVPLEGENPGSLKAPNRWSGRTKPTIAFGQEINVTALQMVSAATVFANRGTLLKPLLVGKIVSPDGKVIKSYQREEVREVLSAEIADGILLRMESATSPEGTARLGRVDGLRISAKTGTSQKFDLERGEYLEDRHVASFLGIFPTDDPRYIVYVVIDSPQVQLDYGSRVAAPVFKEAVERLVTLLDIPVGDTETVQHSGRVIVPQIEDVIIGETMPDLTGVAKRQLLPLLAREDLEVIFKGEGYVVKQSPAEGSVIESGMTLILEFE